MLILSLGFSSLEKELPSLTREKRLSDILDEPGENNATKTEVKEGNHRSVHATVDDDRSMTSGSRPYPHHGIHITRQNERRNSFRGHYKKRGQETHSVPSSKANGESILLDSHLDIGRHHKIILPNVKFAWFSQEVARAPPPSDEMLHRIRMRMKRKKRRRLRELKRISESEAEQQTHERKKSSGQIKRASVEQRSKSAQEEMNTPSNSSKSTEKNKLNFSVPSKQLDISKKREALANNDSSSSLKRPKRIPLNGDNAVTNRFSSLEITLRSKILSLADPESSSPSKDGSESPLSSKSSLTGLSSSSEDETTAEETLRSFFQNAGSAGSSGEKGEARDPPNDIQDKSIKEPRGPGQIYNKKVRQQKRDQGYDDYELKLLEFQKKAIEEEEKRLKEQFGPERQNIQVSKKSTVEQLDRENDEREREVKLLFEKLTKTNKQNSNEHQEQNALHQNEAKRSFGVNANFNNYNINDLDDGNDGGGGLQEKLVQSRKTRKIPKSNDKGMIEKERILNAGGDSGNDDEITEMAFYDNKDYITNQNQNEKNTDDQEWDITGGSQHDRIKGNTSLPTNSDNEETNMQSSERKKPKDIQNNIELDEPVKLASGIEEIKLQNNNEQKDRERPEDEMDYDDLMKSQVFAGENERKAEADISKRQPSKPQNVKNEGKLPGNKGADKDGVEIEVVSDKPNPPIFTEIKDTEQESKNDKIVANENERELFDKETKKEIATSDVSESKTTDNNDNNNKVKSTNPSTSGDSRNDDNNNSNSSSKQNIINEDNDNVMLHDNRLMYILTGEGAKPSKKRAELSNDAKEMTRVKISNTHRETEETQIKQTNNDKPLAPNPIVINKGLKSKIKEMHDRILHAHNRVSQELEQMEQELSTRFNTLQESMSMAKKLTTNMDSKINNSVLSVMKLATSSAKQAKTKLTLVQSKYILSRKSPITYEVSRGRRNLFLLITKCWLEKSKQRAIDSFLFNSRTFAKKTE